MDGLDAKLMDGIADGLKSSFNVGTEIRNQDFTDSQTLNQTRKQYDAEAILKNLAML